ncbi:MAG: hypothetical protein KA004_06405 [Verrucomicrobiales bacterium]|nr:hypothetical protein [Verrucomicrobiales bacterium]
MLPKPVVIRLVLPVCTLLAGSMALGQGENPAPASPPADAQPSATAVQELAKFKELRQLYLEKNQEHARQLQEHYQKQLAALEKQYVAERNYSAAALVKAEREKSARDLGLAPDLPPAANDNPGRALLAEDGTVNMDGKAAETGGGVNWDKEKEALTGWASDKAWAKWHLPAGLQTGGYEVELTFACASGSGGTFFVREDFYLLRREARESGSWDSFHSEVFGTLRIRAGSQSLLISAATVKGGGLFYLKSVRLLPCRTANS